MSIQKKREFLLILIILLASAQCNAETSKKIQTIAEDQFLLGRAYERGEGVGQSFHKAGEWYLRAAGRGNTKAMTNLGILFMEGLGTSRDETVGFQWILKAARLSDPRAMYLAGYFLCTGRGTCVDVSTGVAFLKKAAEMHVPDAILRLGYDYLEGRDGISPNLAHACNLLKPLACENNALACTLLGEAMIRGSEDPVSKQYARYWFGEGASLGNPTAMSKLGELIYRDDPDLAYKWLKASSMMSDLTEKELAALDSCKARLSPNDILILDIDAEIIAKNSHDLNH
jgi:uncharacterized protein